MNDIQQMEGTFGPAEQTGDTAVLEGSAPVSGLRSYPRQLAGYTHGRGRITLTPDNYRPCRNAAQVIEASGYDPQRDLDNPADSVFCAHGAGFVVPWDKVREHMHVESGWGKARPSRPEPEDQPARRAAFRASLEDDAELMRIFEQTYGPIKRDPLAAFRTVKKERPDFDSRQWSVLPEYLLVDGYNIIFAWEELAAIAKDSLAAARQKLMDILCNYQGFRQCGADPGVRRLPGAGQPGERGAVPQHPCGLHPEAETADMFIERVTHEIGRDRRVRVATSDGMEQIIILGHGAYRISARQFRLEVDEVEREIRAMIQQEKG